MLGTCLVLCLVLAWYPMLGTCLVPYAWYLLGTLHTGTLCLVHACDVILPFDNAAKLVLSSLVNNTPLSAFWLRSSIVSVLFLIIIRRCTRQSKCLAPKLCTMSTTLPNSSCQARSICILSTTLPNSSCKARSTCILSTTLPNSSCKARSICILSTTLPNASCHAHSFQYQ